MVSAKASYYWRLRKVREAYLKTADHTQTFVKVPSSAVQPVNMAAEYKIIALMQILLERYAYSEIGGTFILV